MFDRHLVWLNKNGKRLVKSKYQGQYLTRYQSRLYYVVCLYMCIKYFTTLHIPISFNELATDNYKTEKAMIKAEEFEKHMIENVFEYNVYRDTIYDVSPKNYDEYNIRDLLSTYGNINTNYVDITAIELYNILSAQYN